MNWYGNFSRKIAGFIERNFLDGFTLDRNFQSLTRSQTANELSKNANPLIEKAVEVTLEEFGDTKVAVDRNALHNVIDSSIKFAIEYLKDERSLSSSELKLSSEVPLEAYKAALSYILYGMAPQLSEDAFKMLDQAFTSLISPLDHPISGK